MKSAVQATLLATFLVDAHAFLAPNCRHTPLLRLQASTRKDFVSQSLAGAAAVTGAGLTTASPALAKTKSTAWTQVLCTHFICMLCKLT